MLDPGTILQQRFRIVRQIGHGGMGAVYQANHLDLKCIVALKQMLVTTDEASHAFKREAQLLAHLRHPALPNVTDYFADTRIHFLVMDFIPVGLTQTP